MCLNVLLFMLYNVKKHLYFPPWWEFIDWFIVQSAENINMSCLKLFTFCALIIYEGFLTMEGNGCSCCGGEPPGGLAAHLHTLFLLACQCHGRPGRPRAGLRAAASSALMASGHGAPACYSATIAAAGGLRGSGDTLNVLKAPSAPPSRQPVSGR